MARPVSARCAVLASLGLVLACAGCRGGALAGSRPAPPAAAPAAVDVRRYETRIALDVANKSVEGETRITFAYPGPGPRALRFPRNALSVERADYRGRPTAFQADGDTIVIPLPETPTAGAEEEVSLAYHATPQRGLVFGEGLAYADFFTCHWMVCSEEPGDKAALSLEVEAPAGYRIIASGHRVEERTDASGRVHSRWEEERPYSPYLYGFVAGRLVETSIDKGSVRLTFAGLSASESVESLRRKFSDTGRMLAFLEGRAGVPLPHGAYAQVLVPGTEAQEKSSFSVIGAKFLDPILEDPTEDWVIVHELAHQWWGNLITCRDWSQFWLNESLATFLVAAYKEQRWGRPAYERELGLWREHWQVAKDAGFDVPLAYAEPYPSIRVRRAIQYSKGALFLDALRRRMGERAFWRGIETFTRRHAGGTVTSADFQRALQSTSAADISSLFDEWVYPR